MHKKRHTTGRAVIAALILVFGISVVSADQEQRIKQLEEQVEALTEAIEEDGKGGSHWDRIHIGGYGELHYNNLDAEDESRDLDQIDFHRFVLYFGYDFTENLRFVSELELEHALVEDTDDGSGPGEIELEQAYIEYDFNENVSARGGLFLVPLGILNETHEPPTFYGVERNDVENIIVPTTWWVGGGMVTLRFGGGFSWDLALHEGLNMPTNGGSAFRVRSARQKTAQAVAKDGALTTRIKYTGIPALELAGGFQYQSDPSQADDDGVDSGKLFTAHVIYNYGVFGVRALWGRWDFDGAGVEAANADTQQGWYIEPSIKPFSSRFVPLLADKVGFYGRYEDISDAARGQDEFDQWEVGFNYWPHQNVVLKFDYRDRSHDNAGDQGRDFTGFDLGIGYQF